MSDDLFPSGPWTGFFNYTPADRHRMDMHLTFAQGNMSGEGNDDVGAFSIRGGYDGTTKECYWRKYYIGAHMVLYKGFREGKGIWGTWEIPFGGRGGFHIWPLSEGSGEEIAIEEEKTEPAVQPQVLEVKA